MTPTHYFAGVTHFQVLLNLLLSNVNISTLEEFNAVQTNMMHKGGSKPRHLAQSWRCISTCPLIAKAMDLHVYGLHRLEWEVAAAPTQFMRDRSSYELCALAFTFDSSLKECVIREVFEAANKVPSQSILYIANRLAYRKTYLK